MNYTWVILIVLVIAYFLWRRSGSSGVKRMNAGELENRLKSNPHGLTVIDVREPSEFKGGHIANAKNIPLGKLSGKLGTLQREQEIVFVCRSGNRSMMASRQAQKSGLADIYNLTGGMSAWKGPVKK